MVPAYKNPWDFADTILPLEEEMSLTKHELGELECRSNYSIRCLTNINTNKSDLLYKIYGEQVDKSPSFTVTVTVRFLYSNQ